MPNLTDAAIRAGIKRAEIAQKPLVLTDGEGRGAGRLRLTIRPAQARTLAEWYAVQWRDGKKSQVKIGVYPQITLADARKRFSKDFADAIQARESIKLAESAKPGTVTDLFDGYVAHLKGKGKASWVDAKPSLDKAAKTLGATKLAREITGADVVAHLKPIYVNSHPIATPFRVQ
jgi:hypothetical protein